jgi:hypothetical protein
VKAQGERGNDRWMVITFNNTQQPYVILEQGYVTAVLTPGGVFFLNHRLIGEKSKPFHHQNMLICYYYEHYFSMDWNLFQVI